MLKVTKVGQGDAVKGQAEIYQKTGTKWFFKSQVICNLETNAANKKQLLKWAVCWKLVLKYFSH